MFFFLVVHLVYACIYDILYSNFYTLFLQYILFFMDIHDILLMIFNVLNFIVKYQNLRKCDINIRTVITQNNVHVN